MNIKFKRAGRFYAYIVECADGTYYNAVAAEASIKRLSRKEKEDLARMN